MGGREGIRGYLYQALAAVVESMSDSNQWEFLSVEPTDDSEKVDLRWDYGSSVKVVQVKSSANVVRWSQILQCAKELKDESPQATEFELHIFASVSGHFERIAHDVVLVKVGTYPCDSSRQTCIDQAAHRLNILLSSRGQQLRPKPLELFVEWLVYKIFDAGAFSKIISREEFYGLLNTWVEEFVERSGEVHFSEEHVREVTESLTQTISSQVCQSQWIARIEEDAVRGSILNDEQKITFVLGAPGSGKSALLAKITADLQSAGQLVIAFRADEIDRSRPANEWLGERVRFARGFVEFIQECQQFESLTVIIDQLDALADLERIPNCPSALS